MATLYEDIAFVSGSWSSSYTYRVYAINGSLVELRRYEPGSSSYQTGPSIQFNTSTGTWSDLTTGVAPDIFSTTLSGTRTTSISGYPTTLFGWTSAGSLSHKWEISTPSWARSTGPTVTSHYYVDLTENAKVFTSDTVQSSDFTFLKGTSSYTPNSMNLVAISGGYVYDYQHTTTDLYTATIDSQPVSHFYYDSSWTSSPTSYTGRTSSSTRILNVLGKIPSTSSMTYSTTIWNAAAPTRSSDDRLLSVRFYKIGSNAYPATELFVYFYVFGNQNDIKAKFAGYRYEGTTLLDYEVSNEFTIGAQEWISYTFSDDGHDQIVEIKDWVYSDEPEGDGYVAPVTTSSNGGGPPLRYPLIMTNLFNRNRSIYSIGMTHKNTWDLFL